MIFEYSFFHLIHIYFSFYYFIFLHCWLFFIFILLLFKYSCLPFPPTTPPHPSYPHLPPLTPPHLGFVHVSFIVVPENPSPFSPSHLPSGYCPFVLFNISGYIFACLFVLLIRFHLKVRSYGICFLLLGLFHLA